MGKSRAEVKQEMAERIELALDCFKIQKTYTETVHYILAQTDVSQRTAYSTVKRAYAQLEGDDKIERPMRKHQLRETLRVILRKALAGARPNYGAALRACRELALLDGLYSPTEINVGGDITVEHQIRKMTSHDKRTELANLMDQWGDRLLDDNYIDVGEGKSNGKSNGTGQDKGNGHATN